jgi:hypothetical protein
MFLHADFSYGTFCDTLLQKVPKCTIAIQLLKFVQLLGPNTIWMWDDAYQSY